MHLVEQDNRILQVITDFDRRHTGKDYSNKSGDSGITAGELPLVSVCFSLNSSVQMFHVYVEFTLQLSQKSFPLCMKTLYDVVVKDHHLKHFGRLQLGLFLKAIGVPMDEATKFWRGHFTKKPEIDGSRVSFKVSFVYYRLLNHFLTQLCIFLFCSLINSTCIIFATCTATKGNGQIIPHTAV